MLPLIYHPDYSFEFPKDHRFSMDKFIHLYQHLEKKGILTSKNVFRPSKPNHDLILSVHQEKYVNDFVHGNLNKEQQRRLGLPWTPELAHRSIISPSGTLLTAKLALRHGIACHLAGGTHHAKYDGPSGFCIFNDLAITANALVKTLGLKVLIFDLDVHQGDGTAELMASNPDVFTCSIHCQKNFPSKKAVSDLDVGLEKGVNDQEYLSVVSKTLEQCLGQHQPDIVLYDAGIDVYIDDVLGHLDITMDGIRQRDHHVLSTCLNHKIPVATVIGGGYSKNITELTDRHAICIEIAHELLSSSS